MWEDKKMVELNINLLSLSIYLFQLALIFFEHLLCASHCGMAMGGGEWFRPCTWEIYFLPEASTKDYIQIMHWTFPLHQYLWLCNSYLIMKLVELSFLLTNLFNN